MDALFQELMQTLHEACKAVGAELELHAEAHPLDTTLLRRLRRSAGEFGDQANTLALMMQERNADGAMIRGAEELGIYFRDIQERIAFLLAADRA